MSVRTPVTLTAEAAKQVERENAAIARGLKRQDPELLDQLIETYQHRLMRYLMFLTSKREVAEDLFQEVWIRVLRRGSQYNGQARFDTWIFTIARNLVIDLSRKRTMASLDEMREGSEEAETRPFEIVQEGPSPLEQFRVSGECVGGGGGVVDAGSGVSRGADAAVPRRDVAGGDCDGNTGPLVDGEVAAVSWSGCAEAGVAEAASRGGSQPVNTARWR